MLKRIGFFSGILFLSICPLFSLNEAAFLHLHQIGLSSSVKDTVEKKCRGELSKIKRIILMSAAGMDWKYRDQKISIKPYEQYKNLAILGKKLDVDLLYFGWLVRTERKTVLSLGVYDVSGKKEIAFFSRHAASSGKLDTSELVKKIAAVVKKYRKKPSSTDDTSKSKKNVSGKDNKKEKKIAPQKIDQIRRNIVAAAIKQYGRKKQTHFIFKKKKFSFDCSGFAAGVYYHAGVDLFRHGKAFKSGSKKIHHTFKTRYYYSTKGIPRKGDVVFFHNTYDANKDGKDNDYFSHVGIVISSESSGKIVFLHRSSRGVTRGFLHLKRKNDRNYNSYLRRGRKKNRLAGQLYAGFGSLSSKR